VDSVTCLCPFIVTCGFYSSSAAFLTNIDSPIILMLESSAQKRRGGIKQTFLSSDELECCHGDLFSEIRTRRVFSVSVSRFWHVLGGRHSQEPAIFPREYLCSLTYGIHLTLLDNERKVNFFKKNSVIFLTKQRIFFQPKGVKS